MPKLSPACDSPSPVVSSLPSRSYLGSCWRRYYKLHGCLKTGKWPAGPQVDTTGQGP